MEDFKTCGLFSILIFLKYAALLDTRKCCFVLVITFKGADE